MEPVTDYLRLPGRELFSSYPFLRDFFAALGLNGPQRQETAAAYFDSLGAESLESIGLDAQELGARLQAFVEQMLRLRDGSGAQVSTITVVGGQDKSGAPEATSLTLQRGDVICIVGPTGSGKSRLLGDIECLAQADTPTGRRILLDGQPPDEGARLSGEQRLVAQLSQNMNFVMDLSVREFLTMHAESRLVEGIETVVEQIFSTALSLAGEPFSLETPVTALSGGQSRALMIADTAMLSPSPIILIDEIENAGVDRRKALQLLVSKEKIVLMATHDPILALAGDRRVVLRNGGMAAVLETSPAERANLLLLQKVDERLAEVRNRLRAGEQIEGDPASLFPPLTT